jgi:hypothetical protein
VILSSVLRALLLRPLPEQSRFAPGRFRRCVSALLLLVMLSNSALASPQVARAVAGLMLLSISGEQQKLRLWWHARGYASRWALARPQSGGPIPGERPKNALLQPQETQEQRNTKIQDVRIFPGDVTVETGTLVALNAAAFDKDGSVIGGVKFEWTGVNIDNKKDITLGQSLTFVSPLPGKYKMTAEAPGGKKAHVTITVQGEPRKPTDPSKVIFTITGSTRDLPQSKTGSLWRPATESRPGRLTAVRGAQKKPAGTSMSDALRNSVTAMIPARPLAQGGGYEDPYGWNSNNYWSADDGGKERGDMPGHPADGGAGSGNYQLEAPVIGLDGRGLEVNLGLSYNSRVWHKASQSATEVTFDIDRDWPAPGWSLGFGKIIYTGTQGGYMLIDGDGTRRPYSIQVGPGYAGLFFAGKTIDGSFIDYQGDAAANGIPSYATAWLPDGTVIKYSAPANNAIYPITIRDRQGNFIWVRLF